MDVKSLDSTCSKLHFYILICPLHIVLRVIHSNSEWNYTTLSIKIKNRNFSHIDDVIWSNNKIIFMIIKSWYDTAVQTHQGLFHKLFSIRKESNDGHSWNVKHKQLFLMFDQCFRSKGSGRASCPSKDIKNAILKKITEKIKSEMSKGNSWWKNYLRH